jgi:hypothetical protein
MNLSITEWLVTWLNTRSNPITNTVLKQMNGCWDVVYMTKCNDFEQTHAFAVSSLVFDDDHTAQVIDQHGVIRHATRIKHEYAFSISRDSVYWDILKLEECNLKTAIFTITRIRCNPESTSSAKYYARKRHLAQTSCVQKPSNPSSFTQCTRPSPTICSSCSSPPHTPLPSVPRGCGAGPGDDPAFQIHTIVRQMYKSA